MRVLKLASLAALLLLPAIVPAQGMRMVSATKNILGWGNDQGDMAEQDQKVTVTATVTQNGNPVPNVQVHFVPPNVYRTTNSQGRCTCDITPSTCGGSRQCYVTCPPPSVGCVIQIFTFGSYDNTVSSMSAYGSTSSEVLTTGAGEATGHALFWDGEWESDPEENWSGNDIRADTWAFSLAPWYWDDGVVESSGHASYIVYTSFNDAETYSWTPGSDPWDQNPPTQCRFFFGGAVEQRYTGLNKAGVLNWVNPGDPYYDETKNISYSFYNTTESETFLAGHGGYSFRSWEWYTISGIDPEFRTPPDVYFEGTEVTGDDPPEVYYATHGLGQKGSGWTTHLTAFIDCDSLSNCVNADSKFFMGASAFGWIDTPEDIRGFGSDPYPEGGG